jgi:hypothetical protein
VIYVDESGVATNDRFFVVGAIKVRRHGEFARAVRDVRDRTGFDDEFKFSRISRGKLPAFFELVDLLCTPSVHLAACIVDREAFDPNDRWKPKWRAHAYVTAQLLRGCIKQKELVSVCMDLVSTPRDVAIEDEISRMVNARLGNRPLITSICLDSKASDLLQVADLVAGAVAFEQRSLHGISGEPNSNKAKVVQRLRDVMNVESLSGPRSPRLNVQTYKPPGEGRRSQDNTVTKLRPAGKKDQVKPPKGNLRAKSG